MLIGMERGALSTRIADMLESSAPVGMRNIREYYYLLVMICLARENPLYLRHSGLSTPSVAFRPS